ncbi:hypothetical protein [Pedobacter frigidisoli]|uniref:hypothetical protein n=1 Tax=Pedobacter frigidisoli TaxID=2530455 RepID=UPI00292EEFF5|nr:hypothetical protein [Pedobacter frigidisoli]
MARGIKKCYWKTTNGTIYTVAEGGEYQLNADELNEFYVDESCIDDSSKNKKATVDGARWAFIYNGFFSAVQKSNDNSLWGNLSGGTAPVNKWGLGTKYKTGSSIRFAPAGDHFYFGFKQRVEVFSFEPGSGFYFYIVPVTKSNILYAYFTESERIRRYGETIPYQIAFHGYNLEKGKDYSVKMYLLEKPTGAGLHETKDFEAHNVWEKIKVFDIPRTGGGDDFNVRMSGSFPIDIAWKKGENREKEFSLVVEVYRKDKNGQTLVKTKNFAAEPTMDLVQYDPSLLQLRDLDNKPSESSRFIVSSELMDQYLKRMEAQKANQLQFIGDIRYTHKEFDPCGYSTITVKSDDTELIIFDEDAADKVIDRTAQTFDIIAGDARKEISIKVGKLTTKGVLCNGLLLEAGQKHADQKNLFQVDKVQPALRLNGGVYITQPDISQKDDQDVQPDTAKGLSNDVSEIQDWQLNRDYKFNGDDEAILMLRYVYNKTVLENLQSKVSTQNNSALNSLWVFNYFILNEQVSQSYFLPVSTCRYPNQLVKVRVFPDVEWEIAFMVTVGRGYSGKIRYERERMEGHHRGYDFKYLKDDLHVEATQTSNLGWSLKGKCVENGNEHTLGLENVKKTIDTAVYAFDMVHEGLQVLNPQGGVGQSAAVSKRVIEIDFAIDPPNLGFALGWKFGAASTKSIVPIYTGGLRADPLIGLTISVDLVPLIGKIPYVGAIVRAIISVIEYLSDSDIYITFEVAQAVKVNLSLSYNKIDGFRNKGQQKVEYEVAITIKAGCKSNDVIMIPTVTRGGVTETTEMEKWKVEGAASTTFTFTEEVGYNLNTGKQYKESSVVWNPASITITCYELLLSKVTYNPSYSNKMKLFDDKTLYKSGKIELNEK